MGEWVYQCQMFAFSSMQEPISSLFPFLAYDSLVNLSKYVIYFSFISHRLASSHWKHIEQNNFIFSSLPNARGGKGEKKNLNRIINIWLFSIFFWADKNIKNHIWGLTFLKTWMHNICFNLSSSRCFLEVMFFFF